MYGDYVMTDMLGRKGLINSLALIEAEVTFQVYLFFKFILRIDTLNIYTYEIGLSSATEPYWL